MGVTKLLKRHVHHFLFDLLVVFPIVLIIYISLQPHLKNFCAGPGHSGDSSINDLLLQSLPLPAHSQANCTHIISGIAGYVDALPLHRYKLAPISEKDLLNMTADCDLYKVRRKFIPIPLSKEEENFPIAFAMVVHENIEMFERFLRAIYTPQNIYCVHVDIKSPDIYKQAVRAIASCFGNVFVASKLERVVYASWLRVQADLNCMEDLLKREVQWRYLLNTCGTDFPLKTNAEIVRTLKVLNGKNNMESERPSEYKKDRWRFHYNLTNRIFKTESEKSLPPIKTPMFTGNAYYVVSRAFVEYIFQKGTVVEKLLDWAKDTYSPDEHLWATLNRMPEVPGSSPHNDKYDMSDMRAIARLTKWEYHEGDVHAGAPYSPCTGVHRFGVCVYGAGDLKWILEQHHLFANKFDPTVDNTAVQCLEEYLRLKALHGIKP